MSRVTRVGLCSIMLCAICPVGVMAQFDSELVSFEGGDQGDPQNQEMFWEPQWSGSTAGFVVANSAGVFDYNAAFRNANPTFATDGTQALEVSWYWQDEQDAEAWVRLTTYTAPIRPNPSLDTRGKVRLKITNTGSILGGAVGLCLGIRETGKIEAQLADGGTDGPIEWFGVDPTVNAIIAGSNGVADSVASGDDVQEIPFGTTGLNDEDVVISPGLNGVIDSTSAIGDVDRFGYFVNASGGRTPVPAVTIPVSPTTYAVEWDFTAGTVTVNGLSTACAVVSFADGDHVLNPANDRGVLDHLALTNITTDPDNFDPSTFADVLFGLDEIQFSATVPDPVVPPTIVVPVFEGATTVQVQGTAGATQTELFINDVSAGTATPNVNGLSNHFGLTPLVAGDILTATQMKDGGTSEESVPVVVFAAGVVFADNFDTYANQAALNVQWTDSFGSPDPADAIVHLQAGGAASCPNFLREENPASSDAARLYRYIGSVNGTDADPLWVTWNFRYKGTHTGAGARTRFELAHFDGAGWTTAARGEGSAGITLYNALTGDFFNQYNLTLSVPDNAAVAADLTTNGWVEAGNFYHAASGVVHGDDGWHKMQIEVRDTVINYYIDGVNVNPAGHAAGVPRPSTTPYNFLIIGQGASNNGPMMMYDNVSVTQGSGGALHPFGDPITPAPVVEEPVYPSQTVVTLTDVELGATDVTVYADGSPIGDVTTSGFTSTTVDVAVSALVNGDSITAKQTLGGVVSCHSIAADVGVPVLTITNIELVPGQTTVDVSGIAVGAADEVRIYANGSTLVGTLLAPATDTATVTVSALVLDDLITAKQTIGGVEGPASNEVLVRITPDLSLTVTLCLDEDGNGGLSPADFEFVGAAKKTNHAPHGHPLEVNTGIWQSVEFSLIPGEEPVLSFFGGDNALAPDGGDYSIDGVFFSINSNGALSGPYTVYLDHLYYIDAADQKVMLSDAEAVNPLPERRFNEPPTPLPPLSTALTGVTSIDGGNAVQIDWQWANEEPNNYVAPRPNYPRFPMPDTAKAIGFYVLFNDIDTNAVAPPTIEAPILGDVDTVRVVDVSTNATAVELYLNGAFYASVAPTGTQADFDTSLTTLQLLDQFTAKQVTPSGTSEMAFPRGVTDLPPAPSIEVPLQEGATSVTVTGVLTLVNGTASLVSIYDAGGLVASAPGGTDTVVVTVPALVGGQVLEATQTVNGFESARSDSAYVEVAQIPCGVAYSDDFSVDTSASWIQNLTADAQVTFAYDYSADGIPAAPNGSDTLGVKFEANLSSGAGHSVTIAPVGENFGGDYTLKFDMWINANGPFPGGGGGSTEFATAGIGYNGTANNQGGLGGSGGWFAVSGEGGSSRDYRAYKNGGEQFAESGQFFAGTSSAGGGAHNQSDPYYAQFGGIDVALAVPSQTLAHPQQTGTTLEGSVGFEWHEVEVRRIGDTATWFIDGLPIVRLDAATGTSFPLAGNISVGYMDIFTSVSDNPALSFGLVDNVRVEGFPGGDCNGNDIADGCEAVGNGDWDADGDVDLDDFGAFADCLSGPGAMPTPEDANCVSTCLNAFDFDADDDIDLDDFAEFAKLVP